MFLSFFFLPLLVCLLGCGFRAVEAAVWTCQGIFLHQSIFLQFFFSNRLSLKGRDVFNPDWLAPEIILNQPYSISSDVFSYGIILWELISLQHPFDEYSVSEKKTSILNPF